MMSRPHKTGLPQAYTNIEIARDTFRRISDCNSSADGFTMGGNLQLIGSLQSNIQHGIFEHGMKSLHEV